ncbi:MAG: arginyl-tRNA synthetase [Pseudolysinimonas sp.]|uniref:arginyl-tRNA synthetase n=1 Tax=Pseudolysinimonas sp. TaxID=2680009 RepID=UPI00326490C9
MAVASTISIRTASAALLAVAVAVVLAGCIPTPTATTPASTPRPTPTPTATPTPSATPDQLTPIDVACADLVDPDAVYAFDPNLALLGSWTPDAGSAAADAVAAGGVACRWVLESGGGTMDVSVASLSDNRIDALKNDASATSTPVPTYGDEAYFSVEGGVGTAIVFQGNYWLVATSVTFAEPGEPSDIIDSALAALP